jgi:hypothetical protein
MLATNLYDEIYENRYHNGTAHFLLIIEGNTVKVLQLIMSLKVVFSRKIGFIQQKFVFEHS